MLREDKKAGYVTEGAWFWKRHRFCTGKLSGGAITPYQLAQAATAQRSCPVLVLEGDGRQWWWFADRFYWEDDELVADDVMALVLERQRSKRRKLERAHAAMSQEHVAAAPRREPIARDVRLAVWQRDGGRCVECASTFELQYDHVIPFSMGGATSVENLQLLCAGCNRVKGASL